MFRCWSYMPQSMSAYLWMPLVSEILCKIHVGIVLIIKGAPRWTAEDMNMNKTDWQQVFKLISQKSYSIPQYHNTTISQTNKNAKNL